MPRGVVCQVKRIRGRGDVIDSGKANYGGNVEVAHDTTVVQ